MAVAITDIRFKYFSVLCLHFRKSYSIGVMADFLCAALGLNVDPLLAVQGFGSGSFPEANYLALMRIFNATEMVKTNHQNIYICERVKGWQAAQLLLKAAFPNERSGEFFVDLK